MLSELRRIRDRKPGHAAVRCHEAGTWHDTTWEQLIADAESAAARARAHVGGPPVVVVVDGTARSVATVLGLVEAGADAVLLEEQTSQLTDPLSPLGTVGPTTVVGPEPLVRAVASRYPRCLAYGEFRTPGQPPTPPPGRESRILQLTSGSSGAPRLARLAFSHVLVGARQYREVFEFVERDRVLVSVPLAHSYGLAGMLVSLISGATLVTMPRFSIRTVLAAVDDGATAMLGTPMVYRLVAPVLRSRRTKASLRLALSAGGPMTADVAEAAEALGTRVRQIYGITEAGLVCCVPRAAKSWPRGSVGTAAPGVVLRVEAAPDDVVRPAADGVRTGHLLVRGPGLFEGYAGQAGPHLTEDGFYDTGDLVSLDAGGWLTVLGRKSTFINIGGRKVNPRRLERVLSEQDAIGDVYVFGVERPDGEEEIHAAVVLERPARVDEILAHCRAGPLLPYEVPRHVHVLDRMPRTGLGKVDRQAVLAATRSPAAAHTKR